MSEAEIQYLVPKLDKLQAEDVGAIINAIGAYQAEVHFSVIQEAQADTVANDSVLLKLIKRTLAPRYDHDLLEDAERMRSGVEAHFPALERARLAGMFIGVDKRGAIEVEKP